MKYRFDPVDDERITSTDYVVDASSEDAFNVWYRYGHMYGLPLEQDTLGWALIIGRLDDRPIVVNVHWYTLMSQRIAFVEGTSQLVDYKTIEAWESFAFPCLKIHGRHSNAGNFGSVIYDMTKRGFSLQMREPRDVELAVQRLPVSNVPSVLPIADVDTFGVLRFGETMAIRNLADGSLLKLRADDIPALLVALDAIPR